jgi:hypothetical protein
MSRTITRLACLACLATALHAESPVVPDIALAQFWHTGAVSSSNSIDFRGQAFSLGLRVLSADTDGTFRFSLEKGFHTTLGTGAAGASIGSTYAAAVDYLWDRDTNRTWYWGLGLRGDFWKSTPPPRGPFTSMDGTDYGNQSLFLPEAVLGWRLERHVSIELASSLVLNRIQVHFHL